MLGSLVYVRRISGESWEVSHDLKEWLELPGVSANVEDAIEAARTFTGARLVAVTDHQDLSAG